MKKPWKLSSLIWIVIALGCTPQIPKADYPIEIERKYSTSFGNAWNVVTEVVKEFQGNIISQDKESGYILFSVEDIGTKSRYYVNIYIKADTDKNTSVYFIPYTPGGRSLVGVGKNFYEKLNKLL